MPLHHYLPASFLARFSPDSKTEPTRARILVVGDKKKQETFYSPASKVGCIRNLYTLFDNSADPNEIDKTWAGYEKSLPIAIDSLTNNNIDAETWIRVLVPFVACMLVRGPDFTERFDRRWTPIESKILDEPLSSDNSNRARLLELQRLLGFVTTSKWLVLTSKGEENLITNDLGYAPFVNSLYGDIGMAIPLSHSTILAIVPTTTDRPILYEKNNKWMPMIDYLNLPIGNHEDLNKILSQTALRFIFGSDEEIVKKYTQDISPATNPPEPSQLGFPDGRISRAFEFTWHRLIGVIRKPASDIQESDFPLDWEAITSGWHPTPFLPLNLVEFPPPLKRIKKTICTRYYNPEIYYVINQIITLKDSGSFDMAIKEAANAINKKLPAHLKARILALRGDIMTDLGNYRDAIKDYETAITLNSSNADLYVNYGYMLLKAGNTAKSFKILSKAIALNPQHGIAYSNRSVVQFETGHLQDAVNDATSAIMLLPDGVEKASALINRHKVYKELGLEQQGNDDFSKAEELFKKFFHPNRNTFLSKI